MVSVEKNIKKSVNQKEDSPVVAMSVLVGSIYGRLSIKIAHFVPVH
jgi:hypothetical protein